MKLFICSFLLCAAVVAKPQAHYQGPIIDMHVHVAVLPGESGKLGAPNTIQDILPLLQPNHMSNAGIITIAHAGNMAETHSRNDQSAPATRAASPAHPYLLGASNGYHSSLGGNGPPQIKGSKNPETAPFCTTFRCRISTGRGACGKGGRLAYGPAL